MDLETENRIAAILLKEASELRREAQREGALAYLRQPTVRSRPNSRFLTATVRGVQQANRAVEVNEMWRIREKQLELDNRLKGARDSSCSERSYKDVCEPRRSRSTSHNKMETSEAASCSKKQFIEDFDTREEEGLRDDEVDEFLQSRTKRGRGSIGSRMDEIGPYLPSCPDSKSNVSESSDEEQPKKARVLLGPEKPYSLNFSESSDGESHKDKKRKTKDHSSKRHSSRKHKLKEKPKHKKKKREEKKRKHHK